MPKAKPAKSFLLKPIPKKQILISLAATIVGVLLLAVIAVFVIWDNLDDSENYKAAQERCNSKEIVVGSKDLYGNKFYEPKGDPDNVPTMNAQYFCSDAEAEAAEYKRDPLSPVRK